MRHVATDGRCEAARRRLLVLETLPCDVIPLKSIFCGSGKATDNRVLALQLWEQLHCVVLQRTKIEVLGDTLHRMFAALHLLKHMLAIWPRVSRLQCFVQLMSLSQHGVDARWDALPPASIRASC